MSQWYELITSPTTQMFSETQIIGWFNRKSRPAFVRQTARAARKIADFRKSLKWCIKLTITNKGYDIIPKPKHLVEEDRSNYKLRTWYIFNDQWLCHSTVAGLWRFMFTHWLLRLIRNILLLRKLLRKLRNPNEMKTNVLMTYQHIMHSQNLE